MSKQLQIGDAIRATMYGQEIEGRICEIAVNGVYLDCKSPNFAHRDKITHVNGISIDKY